MYMYAPCVHLGYTVCLPFSLALYPWYCSLFPSDSGSLSLVNSASLWLRWDLWCLWEVYLVGLLTYSVPLCFCCLFLVGFKPTPWVVFVLVLWAVLTTLSSPTTCACLGVLYIPSLTYLYMLVFRVL